MHQNRFARQQELFLAARQLPPEQWREFLHKRAAADEELANEVLALLEADRDSNALLADIGATAREPGSMPASLAPQSSPSELLQRLSQRLPTDAKYDFKEEIGRGGMGKVIRVHDPDLRRSLAMKLVLADEGADGSMQASSQLLQRFLDEAQITGQLDHPGIVPVHELGLSDKGRMYFTMRLIRGETADKVFQKARDQVDGWTITRALDVILKVCDTMQFAHGKGVLHRDLKPSNIMVGRYGETYVVDWGLAKLIGQEDRRDLRIKPRERAVSKILTERAVREADGDSPMLTMDGTIVGTPSFMSPEQANGDIDSIDERTDVYAIGCMLYHLLAGSEPHTTPGTPQSPYAILNAVRSGPPTPVPASNKLAPAELIAICDKAMDRDREQRYPTVADLAADLRAFLDRRVVGAYRTGAMAELYKWIYRNRTAATALASAMLSIVAGVFFVADYAREAASERLQKQAQTEAASKAEARQSEAERQASEADQRREQANRDMRSIRRKKQRVEQMIARFQVRRAIVEAVARIEAVDQRLHNLSSVMASDPATDQLGVLLDPLAASIAPNHTGYWQANFSCQPAAKATSQPDYGRASPCCSGAIQTMASPSLFVSAALTRSPTSPFNTIETGNQQRATSSSRPSRSATSFGRRVSHSTTTR